ncbi:MAG TPA: hypothetical protein VFR03_11840 [Thermoanaerobaculia bacterium]|nr:hypothetical protein [Thermoanaerobaculia bacterium]
MTVAFLSLFFGLITGLYPVELSVDGPAAAVEIQIDGRTAGRVVAPPWKTMVDFGPELLPHQVAALALDAQGRELARDEEWVNLPHPLARLDVLLERQGNGPAKAAKLVWKNLAGETVRSASLTFDGQPVKLDKDGRGVLPPHDLSTLHLLAARVDFIPYRSVRRELAYGGEYGSEVATELTGVPVRVTAGKLPPAGQLAGWLAADGKPLSVDAVEDGPAQLFVVAAVPGSDLDTKVSKLQKLTWNLLAPGDELFFVSPLPQRVTGSNETSDLFPISQPSRALREGTTDLFRGLRKIRFPSTVTPSFRAADAVASAGLAAMTQNRRRAVLLILSGDQEDDSFYDPATVRRFLAALRVPLFVWYLGTPKPGSAAAAWGAEEMTQSWHVAAGADHIRKELDSQRIVMVDGRHLPQSIALTAKAAGVELVGGNAVGKRALQSRHEVLP